MSIGFALLATTFIAAAGGVADEPHSTASASATARVVRPVRIRIDRDTAEVSIDAAQTQTPQRVRDDAGTLWIEFS